MTEIRKDDKGHFDELVGGPFKAHFEMLDDKTLWIGLTGDDGEDYRVVVSSPKRLAVKVEKE